MKINHNMAAVITNNQLLRTEDKLSQTMERLSSGLKINHAKDDAAGMAISSKMQSQIDGLDQASRNGSDGMSVIETADGALNEVVNIIQRMRELSVQAANGINSQDDKQAVQDEISSLKEEIDRISKDTEFNAKPLLDGNLAKRVYPSTSGVSRVEVSDEVPSGCYSLEMASAKQAEVDVTLPTGTLPSDTFFSINGVEVTFQTGETADDVKEKLRNTAEQAGVKLIEDNGQYKLQTDAYGSSAQIKINSDSDLFGIGTTVDVTGTDSKVTLTTTGDDAFSHTATAQADGNRITVTDRNGFELSFYAESGFTNETITFEVTDIGPMTLQIGAREHQIMNVVIPELSTESMYIDDVDVTKVGGPEKAMNSLDGALKKVSSVRSKLGAYENRLDSATASLDQAQENLTQALSRISDADMAEEMTEYTKLNVLSQAATSVLAQANDQPQQVLQLLK
ncbi:MAG: flagellin [Lachnospiraceae bacterium]